MLYEVMQHLRNFFPSGIYRRAEFAIEDGTISLDFVKPGQIILIEGSTMNDGVYTYPVTDLRDESFSGKVTILMPPMALVKVADDIKAFCESSASPSVYTSESFEGTSRSRATNASGGLADWQTAFRERLNPWRKI